MTATWAKYIKGYTVNATTLGMETYGLVKYNITIDNLGSYRYCEFRLPRSD